MTLITLKVLTDIYTQPKSPEEKSKLIKRNVESLKQFDTTSMLVEQYVNPRGIVSKRWSIIKEGDNYFRVNHRFKELEKLTGRIRVKGFI